MVWSYYYRGWGIVAYNEHFCDSPYLQLHFLESEMHLCSKISTTLKSITAFTPSLSAVRRDVPINARSALHGALACVLICAAGVVGTCACAAMFWNQFWEKNALCVGDYLLYMLTHEYHANLMAPNMVVRYLTIYLGKAALRLAKELHRLRALQPWLVDDELR